MQVFFIFLNVSATIVAKSPDLKYGVLFMTVTPVEETFTCCCGLISTIPSFFVWCFFHGTSLAFLKIKFPFFVPWALTMIETSAQQSSIFPRISSSCFRNEEKLLLQPLVSIANVFPSIRKSAGCISCMFSGSTPSFFRSFFSLLYEFLETFIRVV